MGRPPTGLGLAQRGREQGLPMGEASEFRGNDAPARSPVLDGLGGQGTVRDNDLLNTCP